MRWPVILADPPWSFRDSGSRMHPGYSGTGRALSYYETSPQRRLDADAALLGQVAAPDGLLFLWAPNSMVLDGQAQRYAQMAGYSLKQLITWTKTSASGAPRLGGGHYTRVCTEQLILCTRGHATRLVVDRGVPGAILAPRGEHSQKPDAQYDLIERLARGPYLEVYARRRRRGWTSWGWQLEELERGETSQ